MNLSKFTQINKSVAHSILGKSTGVKKNLIFTILVFFSRKEINYILSIIGHFAIKKRCNLDVFCTNSGFKLTTLDSMVSEDILRFQYEIKEVPDVPCPAF